MCQDIILDSVSCIGLACLDIVSAFLVIALGCFDIALVCLDNAFAMSL